MKTGTAALRRFSLSPGSRRGFTLVESMISTSIMVFVFSATTWLLVFMAHSTRTIHAQMMVQQNAGDAMEKITTVLRNAMDVTVTDNPTEGVVQQVDYTDVPTNKAGRIRFCMSDHPGTDIADEYNPGYIQIIDPASDTILRTYPRIAKVEFSTAPGNQVGILLEYHYPGYRRDDTKTDHLDEFDVPDSSMGGRFQTTVVAGKDHVLLEGLQYGSPDKSTNVHLEI